MLLFTRILGFKRELMAKLRDRRKAPRFPVGPKFPVKATVNLTGRAGASNPATGYDWGGRLVNLSDLGVSLQLLRAATTVRGEETVLRLELEGHELTVPCVVAYFRTYSAYSVCGLQLKFADRAKHQAYLQLVEAVSLGASFVPAKGRGSAQPRTPAPAQRYSSGSKAVLIGRRDASTGEPDSFELTLGDHCLKGGKTVPPLAVFRQGRTPQPESSPEVESEVRRLFRWIVPNLPNSVPADLRALLEFSANSRPPGRGAAASRPSAPPSQWEQPERRQ